MLTTTRDRFPDPVGPDVEAQSANGAGRVGRHTSAFGSQCSKSRRPLVFGKAAPSGRVSTMLPPFGELVGHIDGLRPEEQVIRPHALANVALMQDVCTIGYGAVVQNPREPMRWYVCGSVGAVGFAQTAVATGIARAEPEPARLGFANLAPEAFVQSFDRAPAWNDCAAFRA